MFGILENALFLDGDGCSSAARIASGRVHLWCGCDKLVDVGIAGAFIVRSMKIVFGKPFWSIVSI